MELTISIFGVDIDFAPDDEIKFKFMIQDDGTWNTEEEAFKVELIPQIVEVMKKVQEHLSAKKKSLKLFTIKDVAAELRDAKSKHDKHAVIVYLFLNSNSSPAIRYGQDWNSILVELMEKAQRYCEGLGVAFDDPTTSSSTQPK